MAAHSPGMVSKKNKGVLEMSPQQMHDFAATPEKGLPKKKGHGMKGKKK